MLLVAGILMPSCQSMSSAKIVVYTSVDQVFSEPILKLFEERYGIQVLPVYDVEAAKTTGLVNRLIAEKGRPQADVFWSGEFVQTISLKKEGVLAPYKSASAADIPGQYKDSDGYWTGFSGRAHVLLVNTTLVPAANYPKSVLDLVDDKWQATKIGVAYPLFGTTANEAAALYAVLGRDKARVFYQKLHDRGIRVVDGASVVRDLVSNGQLMMGFADTDDGCEAMANGAPVTIVFLDQNGMGSLVIPNTVGLIANAPHPDHAKKFIDFLLSPEITKSLVEAGWCHIPLRSIDVHLRCNLNTNIKSMNVSLEDVYSQLAVSAKDLSEIYIR
jgi:iron(III) transport system substrate-binding protein